MDDIPLSWLSIALVILLGLSGFFSLAETSMMAANRYRLRHRAEQGHPGARLALSLLSRTDKMLGVILLGNNLINAASATLVSIITIELFGEEKWALGAGTLLVTFAILVFSEITPKIIGASYSDRLVLVLGYLLYPLLRVSYPIVWFVNLFAQGLLRLLRLAPGPDDQTPQLSAEELRSIVLEAGHFIPDQHREILFNLFDLESITVGDIMLPRGEIESIDISDPLETILHQLATSYHSRVMVCDGDLSNVVGVLHRRSLLPHAFAGELSYAVLREQIVAPYFIAAATPIYAQMKLFRDERQKFGLVVDEYGEIQGLVTLEAIVEEIIGKFTTSLPGASRQYAWAEDGTVLIDGGASLRDLNRQLELDFPVDGPRTLNGLILEQLQSIPESGVSLRIGSAYLEIVQTEHRRIRIVKLQRPLAPR